MLTVALDPVHAVRLLSASDRRPDQSWTRSRGKVRCTAALGSWPGLGWVALILNKEEMEGLESGARMP
jgi:hypothetical protein